MQFFHILRSSPAWQCCCLTLAHLPVNPLLLSLIGRNQLALKQTKQEVAEYISEFLISDFGVNSTTEPFQSAGRRNTGGEEFLLSPEELQALLSA